VAIPMLDEEHGTTSVVPPRRFDRVVENLTEGRAVKQTRHLVVGS
jgi:hypothetical protein